MDDRRHGIEDFVLYALRALRPFASTLVVVALGGVTPHARQALDELVDDVIVRRDTAPGVWAYREALEHVGSAAGDYDEVLLTGDGWFGPVHDLGPVFQRMNRRSLDMWGMTDRRDRWDDDTRKDGVVSISPYWIAARKRLVNSDAWARYWRDLPTRRPEGWRAHRLELDLTAHFVKRGFRQGSAFPEIDYPADHPDMFNIELLLADGCPAVVRGAFDGYPLFFDQHAVIGRRIAQMMQRTGYPVELLWRNLARTIAPKTLNTVAAMLEILPGTPRSTPRDDRRILVVAHVARLEAVDELFRRIQTIPGRLDVVATVAEHEWVNEVHALWHGTEGQGDIGSFEVRVAEGRRGPDTAAVFAECNDLLNGGTHELIVALHTGVPVGRVRNVHRYFRRQQFESLLHSRGYVTNLFALFDREPGLGLVFPPTPHIGMSTLGAGWRDTRATAERLLRRLGVQVPLDWASPHGPVGGMWIGRPEAVADLASLPWPADDVALIDAHSQLHAYVAGENGYHTRTVATAEHAALSHGSLEYTLDHMSMTMYGYPAGYTAILHRAGPVGTGRAVDFARMYLRYRRPRVLRLAAHAARVARRARAVARLVTGRRDQGGGAH
jgi:lipopolysaccharide biosynthesis protein